MNTYIIYYKAFTENNLLIGEASMVVEAYSENEACKIASLKIEGKHAIIFSSQIKGPVNPNQ